MSSEAQRNWYQHPYIALILLVLSKIGVGGLNLLAFMLMAASVGAGDISAYAVDVAIVAALMATSESSEYAYVRVMAVSPKLLWPHIALHMIRAKAITIGLCLLVMLLVPLGYGLAAYDLPRWTSILPLVCLQGIMTTLLGAHTSYLSGRDSQRAYTWVNFVNALASMAAAVWVWWVDGDISIYLSVNAGLTFFIIACVYWGSVRVCGRMSMMVWRSRRGSSAKRRVIGDQYHAVYKSVLGVAYLSTIKNNTLIFVMGHQGNDQALAAFAVAKRVFDFLHKGMAGFLEQLYVRLSKMADDGRSKLESGIGKLYCLRIAVALGAGAMLWFYSRISGDDAWPDSYLALIAVVGAFVMLYFATIATLMVSKYEPLELFRSAVYSASIYAIVPLVFANALPPAFTPLAHLACSVLAGLPLCIRTFSSHDFGRVLIWYGVTVLIVTLGLAWLLIGYWMR